MKRLTYTGGGKWRLRIGDTEYSGKAVDRLAAYEGTGLEPEEIYAMRQLIEMQPAADVAPVRHGRWIYGEDIDIQCSVCGADALTEGDYRQTRSNYCPNCGARMDGENEMD